MKCQPCGQDNAAAALFCTACRRPLVAPSKLPTRIEPLAQPAMAAAAPAMAVPEAAASDFAPSRNRFAPPDAGRTSRMGNLSELLTDEEAWDAVVGHAGAPYYGRHFERLAHGGSGGWHWPALFVTWFWMLYRKMWVPALLWAVAYFGVSIFVTALAPASPIFAGLLSIAWLVFWLIGPALLANRWYYKHCLEKIRVVRARGGSKEQTLARLESVGGTSNIAVIVISVLAIGFVGFSILAAIALPQYQTYVMKAKVAEAMPLANEVTAAVGRQYEQTGTLLTQGDVDAIVAHSAFHPRAVMGVELDDVHATVTLRIATGARTTGALQYTLTADNNRHPTWTCSSEDLKRYVPASCQP